MIDEHIIREVVDEMTKPMTRQEPERPRKPTGGERSKAYAQTAHARASISRQVDAVPQTIAPNSMIAQASFRADTLSQRDRDKLRAAERKRYRRRTRGW